MRPVCLDTIFLGDHQVCYSSDTIMHYSSIITTHAGLNSLVNTLDNRADEHPTTGTGKLLLKLRSESMLSTISPPLNAPSWAVDASFQFHDLPSPHLPPQSLNPIGSWMRPQDDHLFRADDSLSVLKRFLRPFNFNSLLFQFVPRY